MPPGTGPLNPDLSGIDPALMEQFIAAVERAHGVIGEQSATLRRELDRVSADASALTPLKEIEDWVGRQLPELRARHQTITRQTGDWRPGSLPTGLVSYDEGALTTSPEESRRAGAALAARFRQPGDLSQAELDARSRDLLGRLLAHRADGDYTASFFAELGATAIAALPEQIRRAWGGPVQTRVSAEDAQAVDARLVELGTAFSSAAAAVPRVKGIQKVMDDLARDGDAEALSWLVLSGDFPAVWLADVARRHAVLPMARDAVPFPHKLHGTTARFLNALAANPAAARLAVTALAQDWHPAATSPVDPPLRAPLGSVLTTMSASASDDARLGEAFGKLLAAASGAYDEKDGAHTPAAAKFAFTVLTTAPSFSLHDNMRIHLSETAASYVTEITAGAEYSDPDSQQPSRFGAFDDQLAGTHPAFRLSIMDAYRYLQTFADTDAHLKPFDKAMAGLASRLFAEGIRIDKDRIANPPPGGLQAELAVQQAMARLGQVAGMELSAQKLVLGSEDIRNEEAGEVIGQMIDKGGDLVMLSVPTGAYPSALAWTVFGWIAKGGLEAVFESDPKLPKVNAKEFAAARVTIHEIASGLLSHGYTMKGDPVAFKPPTDPLIVDGEGRLRKFQEFDKDPKKMTALLEWLKANGSTNMDADRRTFGKVLFGTADAFSGNKTRMETFLTGADPQLEKIVIGKD
ncbi:hypothetical protein [Microtetraspora sp. NBRC 13810]|uniref:hypothetical protein n=1 Tax=Microtetraspora sp. NBRC 13810 TaxID=3030990 RepID=UPI00255304D9|nr:hypothetical protein [Microtetraspora sp. NBRC 13810]